MNMSPIKLETNNCSLLKWNTTCRACLSEDMSLQPLFYSVNPSTESEVNLSEMMVSCTALKISADDTFPQQLCTDCVQQLCNAFNFKIKCQQSDEQLHQMKLKQEIESEIDLNPSDIKSEMEADETSLITANIETVLDDTSQKSDNVNNVPSTKRNVRKRSLDMKTKRVVKRNVIKPRIRSKRIVKQKKENINIDKDEKTENALITDFNKDDTPEYDPIRKKQKNYTKKHICPECGKRFDSQKRLDSHRASMTHKRNQPGKTIKTCLRCRIYFEDPAEYLEHAKSHDIYLCPDCGRVCKSQSGYQAHLLSHSNLRPHECTECGKKYKSISSLQVHQRNHTGERRYACEQCGDKFITWNSMTYHIQRYHSEERNYVCHFCSKAFLRSGNLNIHMRLHTGEKPYPCSECDMRFRSKGDLTGHMVKHTGERKYPCKVCNKRFSRPYNVTQHMVTHTGERKHVCSICGRAFTQAHVLRGHMRSHPEYIMQQPISQTQPTNGSILNE